MAAQEVVLVPPTPADTSQLALLADLQWLEPFGSEALNRKLLGVMPRGVYRGFGYSLPGGMTLRIGPSDEPGTAIVETGKVAITVQQVKAVDLVVPANFDGYLVLEATYGIGTVTKQVSTDATIDAAKLKLVARALLLPEHVILYTVTTPPGLVTLLASHITTAGRMYGGYLPITGGRLLGKTTFGGSDSGLNIEGGNGAAGGAGDFRYNPITQSFEGYFKGKWRPVGGGAGVGWEVITASVSAEVSKGYLVNAAGLTVTLPANPEAGSAVGVGDYNGNNYGVTVARNGAKIMGLAEDFTLDVQNANVVFSYVDAVVGWVLTQGFGESQAPQAIVNKVRKTNVAGQSTFGVDNNGSLYIDVYYNGFKLDSVTDYTVDNAANTVTLTVPVEKNEHVVEFYCWNQALVLNLESLGLIRKSGDTATGDILGVTAPQFANDKKFATTEFVQRALGNSQGTVSINANATLTAADAGKIITCYGTAGFTVTLPPLSSVWEGGTFIFRNDISGGAVTINRQGTDTIAIAGGSYTTHTIGVGEFCFVQKSANGWRLLGSSTLKNEAQFGSSLAASGYQKLPSGLIVQWGSNTFTSNGVNNQAVTFPIAFPNSCFIVNMGSFENAPTPNDPPVQTRSPTTTGFTAYCFNAIAGSTAYMYIAIGY